MVRATWWTFADSLRSRLVLLLLILPLAFAGAVYGGLVSRNNTLYTENLRYVERLAERLEQHNITAEGIRLGQRNADERRLALARSQRFLEPPRSIQIFAQSLASPGSLFALLLGAMVMGPLFSANTLPTASRAKLRGSGLILSRMAALPLLWGVVSLALVPLALAAGLAALPFLPQASLGSGPTLLQLFTAIAGVWFVGMSWSLVGGGLAVAARSWVLPIAIGVLAWVGEFVAAILVPGVARWSPTFGITGLISKGASRFYDGSLYAVGNNNYLSWGPQTELAPALLLGLALMFVAWGVWRYRRAELA